MQRLRGGINTAVAISLVLLVALIGIVLFRTLGSDTPEQAIVRTLGECTTDGHRIDMSRSCLERVVPPLLDTFSTRQILSVIDSSTAPNAVNANCHVIAHTVGIELFRRTQDDEAALMQCTQQCGGGCVHGVVGAAVMKELGSSYAAEEIEHLSASEITAVGEKYCRTSPSLCHSIGHILYLASRSITQSVQGCDQISTDQKNEKCYRGIFMESVGGEESLFKGDNATSAPEETPEYDCARAPLSAQHACYQYLYTYQENVFEWQKVYDPAERLRLRLKTCTDLPRNARSWCFEGIGAATSLYATAPDDAEAQWNLCLILPDETDRLACTLGEATGYVRYERYAEAIAFCSSIPDEKQRALCFDASFYTMKLNSGNEGRQNIRAMCESTSSPGECYARFNDYESVTPPPAYRHGLYEVLN